MTHTLTLTLDATNTLEAARAMVQDGPYDALHILVPAAEMSQAYGPLHLASYMDLLTTNATVKIEVSNVDESTNLQALSTSLLLAGLVEERQTTNDDSTVVLEATRQTHTRVAALPLETPPDLQEASKGDDCSGRAPCADCTCGRADSNAQQQPQTSSSCGKCGLGDAFRCANCPYLGKPAFKAGEEHLVLLDLQDDL